MKANTKLVTAALLATGLAGAAVAQSAQEHMNHGHANHSAAAPSDSPATKNFRDVAAAMHRDMDIRYTNDIDVYFVRGMIPHHTGAIAMARVALQHSKDPEIRQLAEKIIKDQEVEITQMQAFLKRRGG